MRPKLLDLFCCEGGASRGYADAGFDVYGVDLFEDYSQKRYPYPSAKKNAFWALDGMAHHHTGIPFNNGEWISIYEFDAVAASCPCQRYSITNAARRHDYPDLIGPTRRALKSLGVPYIIENVVGAPLNDPTLLCGCMFDLIATDTDGIKVHLQRARLFETNWELTAPRECDHSDHEWVAGAYGGARRDKYEAKYVRKGGYVPRDKSVVQELLGIDWMTWKGMYQAIPPAYTEHIGKQLMAVLS